MVTESSPTPADPSLTAPAFSALWRTLGPAERGRAAAAAGTALHRAWRDGYCVEDIPPALWLWDPALLIPRPPAHEETEQRAKPATSHLALAAGLWMWSEWPGFDTVQQHRFLRTLADAAGMTPRARHRLDRRAWRLLRKEGFKRAGEVRDAVCQFVLESCRQSVDARGLWCPDPRWSAAEFRTAVEAALRAPEATAKRSSINTVVRATLSGFDVAIKRFGRPARHRRWTYRWRASRARRAWIAGEVFRRLGLRTPEPLGFVEVLRNGQVTESYLITAWVDATHLRAAVTSLPALAGRAPREAFRRAWLGLLWRGVYHADTKLENVLATGDHLAPGGYAWIDLECVHLAGRLTPYRVIRNLVQMNGALPDSVGLRARLGFLAGLPGHWRLARHRLGRGLIARWTARRKRGEAGRRCSS